MHNSTPEGGRKQRQLADGRTSRGYVPAEVELLDAPISGDALALVLRIRKDCDHRESDGFIEQRALDALAVYYSVPPRKLPALLAELEREQLVKVVDGGVIDSNYLVHARSHEERERQRAGWRARQAQHRDSDGESPPPSREVSRRDTPRESRRASRQESQGESRRVSHSPSPDPSPYAPSPSASAASTTGPKGPVEKGLALKASASGPANGEPLTANADPRDELGDRLVVEVAPLMAGGVLSPLDQKRVRNWPYAFQHLAGRGDDAFLAMCRQRAKQATERGDPIRTVQYFEAPLGELDAAIVDNQAVPTGRNHVAGGMTRIGDIQLPGAAAG